MGESRKDALRVNFDKKVASARYFPYSSYNFVRFSGFHVASYAITLKEGECCD